MSLITQKMWVFEYLISSYFHYVPALMILWEFLELHKELRVLFSSSLTGVYDIKQHINLSEYDKRSLLLFFFIFTVLNTTHTKKNYNRVTFFKALFAWQQKYIFVPSVFLTSGVDLDTCFMLMNLQATPFLTFFY